MSCISCIKHKAKPFFLTVLSDISYFSLAVCPLDHCPLLCWLSLWSSSIPVVIMNTSYNLGDVTLIWRHHRGHVPGKNGAPTTVRSAPPTSCGQSTVLSPCSLQTNRGVCYMGGCGNLPPGLNLASTPATLFVKLNPEWLQGPFRTNWLSSPAVAVAPHLHLEMMVAAHPLHQPR